MSDGGAWTDGVRNSVTDLPKTALVLAAQHLVVPVLPQSILEHSIRTFLYGRAWARSEQVTFDEEDLMVASLFHDVGLFEPFKEPGRAFQFNSSRALAGMLAARGIDGRRIDRLVDAIDHHFQLTPGWSYGPEAGLLHIGAYMDAIGLRRRAVRSAARLIRREYPLHSSLTLFAWIARSVRGPRSCLGLVFPDTFGDRMPRFDALPTHNHD